LNYEFRILGHMVAAKEKSGLVQIAMCRPTVRMCRQTMGGAVELSVVLNSCMQVGVCEGEGQNYTKR